MKKTIIILVGVLAMSLVGCTHNKSHEHKGHKGHHKKMWKMMDADGDGAVTRKEFDTAHTGMFAKMDANGDGKITMEEKKAHRKMMKSEGKKACCK